MKTETSDKVDTKSTERPINKTGLRVAMYAGRLNERVEELEKENAALRADLLIEEERSVYWRDLEGKALAENAALKQQCKTCETAAVIDSYVRENTALRDELKSVHRKWKSDKIFMAGAFELLKEVGKMPSSDELIAAADRAAREEKP
jgi:hypothetical protein